LVTASITGTWGRRARHPDHGLGAWHYPGAEAAARGGTRTDRTGLSATDYYCLLKYLDQHLAEPDLNAESIAVAHHVSVRTLYTAWSMANRVPLGQWVIAARLERARDQLSLGSQALSIAAVARR